MSNTTGRAESVSAITSCNLTTNGHVDNASSVHIDTLNTDRASIMLRIGEWGAVTLFLNRESAAAIVEGLQGEIAKKDAAHEAAVKAAIIAYPLDPGHSDLDDEQHMSIPLLDGAWYATDLGTVRRVQAGGTLAAPPPVAMDWQEAFEEHREVLKDLTYLHNEEDALNGGGPGIAGRWAAAWARANELFEP